MNLGELERITTRLEEVEAQQHERSSVTRELENYFDLSRELLVVADKVRFKHVNYEWCRLLGRTMREMISTPWMEMVHPDDQAKTTAAVTLMESGDVVGFQNRYLDADGTPHLIEWAAAAWSIHGKTVARAKHLCPKECPKW